MTKDTRTKDEKLAAPQRYTYKSKGLDMSQKIQAWQESSAVVDGYDGKFFVVSSRS